MKANVAMSENKIVIEHRYPSFIADGSLASEESTLIDGVFAGLNLILDKKISITLDKNDRTLTIREKGRLRKENMRVYNSLQLSKFLIYIHTQKKFLRRPKKSVVVQLLTKRNTEDPIIFFLNEPYRESIDVVSKVSELLGLPVEERAVVNKG